MVSCEDEFREDDASGQCKLVGGFTSPGNGNKSQSLSSLKDFFFLGFFITEQSGK